MAEYTLRVGQEAPIKRGFFKKSSITYAGMTNEKTYSLVVSLSIGYNSMAYNLFLPVTRREIRVGKNRFIVLRVSDEEIHLRD